MIIKLFNYLTVCFLVIPVAVLLSCNAFAGDTGRKFVFGIEYFMLLNAYEIAGYYSEIGATSSKTNGPATFWEAIEPEPPKNGIHTYHWKKFDRGIKAMQDAGFTDITVVLGPKSSWGSKGYLNRKNPKTASTPPKDDKECAKDNPNMGMTCWQAYKDYVRAFVSRYSGDVARLGLKAPVLYYEIMTEAQHDIQWQVPESLDPVDEYIRVLKASYETAKSVNPEVKIILSGMMSFDLFDDGPLTDAARDRKFSERKKLPPKGKGYRKRDCRNRIMKGLKEQLDFNARILKEKDYYDEVEFHLLSYYTAIEGTVDWIRRQMPVDKPIWAGDAGIAPSIPSHNRTGIMACLNTVNVFSAAHYDDGDKIYKVLTSKKDKFGYSYEKEVLPWFYKEQSNFLSKSLIIEMSLGLAGTNVYTWLDGEPSAITTGWLKQWMIHGLRDGSFNPKRRVGEPRPVFYTYKLIIDKLGKFSSVETLKNKNSRIKAYKFIVNDRPIYVQWYEDDIHHKPGKKEGSITIDASSIMGKSKVKITHMVTKKGQSRPDIEFSSSSKITLTKTPVFIEKI